MKNCILVVLIFFLFSCSESSSMSSDNKEEVITPPENFPYVFGKKPTGGKEVYVPKELQNNNFDSKKSKWCYQRSAASDDIIVFWEEGFGANPATAQKESMRINIEGLLTKAEKFYAYYRDEMKFVNKGNSNTDKYRMIIMLIYQDEWLATGSGYDDVIGALWVNPSTTTNELSHVIAHEFGHTFQYQVKCDGSYGFRDQNYVGTFWEQCAQYMSWQLYPDDKIRDLPFFLKNTHKNFSHEDIRYESIYLMEYWKQKHGKEFLGKLWKEAIAPEHPLQTYKRITNSTQEQLNDEIFEYACRNITWDYPLGSHNVNFINSLPKSQQEEYRHKTKLILSTDNYYEISADQIPQSYGYNAIELEAPKAGTTVSIAFEGIDNKWKSIAGWRFGFVAVKTDSKVIYGEMKRDSKGTVSFTAADDLKEFWLVVTGAPTEHVNHVWDDNSDNDENFPYKIKLTNTSLK